MAKASTNAQTIDSMQLSEAAVPSVFNYENFREYLKDWLNNRKQSQSTYSGALFAKRAGIQAHSLLGMVIRGDRNLTHDSIRSFSRALELSSHEALFFEKLVLFNQAKHPEDQSFYLEQLLTVSQGQSQHVFSRLHDYSEYLAHWYIVAIKELMEIKDFKTDPSWISARFQGKISKAQAEEALQLLERLGFIKWNARRDHFEIQSGNIDIDPGRVSFAIRRFHKECLRIAIESLDSASVAHRQISSVTLSVSLSEVELVKRRLGQFVKQLLAEFPSKQSSHLREVIQVTGMFVQLTDKLPLNSVNKSGKDPHK